MNKQQIEQVLELAQNHPTTYTFARDSKGRATHPLSAAAVCFCLLGAIIKVSHQPSMPDEAKQNLASSQLLWDAMREDQFVGEIAKELIAACARKPPPGTNPAVYVSAVFDEDIENGNTHCISAVKRILEKAE